MGCCASRQVVSKTSDSANESWGVGRELPLPVGVLEAATCACQDSSGFQVGVATAGWVATLPFVGFTDVHTQPTGLFVALFETSEGVGDKAAQDFARSRARCLFLSLLADTNDPLAALKQTWNHLQESFSAYTKGSAQARRASVAPGSLVYIHSQERRAYVATRGCSKAVAGRVLGGFNAESCEVVSLSKTDGLRGEAGSGLHLTTLDLTPTHSHIIIATSGFCNLVDADASMLRLHCYAKASASNDAGGRFGTAALQQPSDNRNPARHLVLYAVSKVSDVLTQRVRQAGEPDCINVADLEHIPMRAHQSASDSTRNAISLPEPTVKQTFLAKFLRRDLHADIGVAVISLQWPAVSPSIIRVGVHHGRFTHWGMIRMLYNFHRMQRKAILQKWWTVAAELQRVGKHKALALEQRIWKEKKLAVKVTPSLRIIDTNGNTVDPAEIHLYASAI